MGRVFSAGKVQHILEQVLGNDVPLLTLQKLRFEHQLDQIVRIFVLSQRISIVQDRKQQSMENGEGGLLIGTSVFGAQQIDDPLQNTLDDAATVLILNRKKTVNECKPRQNLES